MWIILRCMVRGYNEILALEPHIEQHCGASTRTKIMEPEIVDAPMTGTIRRPKHSDHCCDRDTRQSRSFAFHRKASYSPAISQRGRHHEARRYFWVVLSLSWGIVASHQLSESGNDHFDKAGENWKQN
ncbi:MAG: hypothetical protein CM15mP74_28100 [Halieaceae bacterium]|nr:MAG: hypothetical protein CM15mP74_28100 [Halieaceae bacterium]